MAIMRELPRRRRRLVRPKRSVRANRGYEIGYAKGYAEGFQEGAVRLGEQLNITSIIIPTFNKKKYLMQCINSIRAHTSLPYEIIVVDNGSTDGTREYLLKQGRSIRYWINKKNRGFAGAINQGLMMAKGSTLLLLNNDVIVTHRWLDNMLACLNSNPAIGIVGPVTNRSSGKQRIAVNYRSIPEMHRFAQSFNRSDPNLWEIADRVIGFCMLMPREVFLRVGYLDEGYEYGNYEDDDLNVRVRMLGYELRIARDTFIHHYGSVSIRAFGKRFARFTGKNKRFYADKWQNPETLLGHLRLTGAEAIKAGETRRQSKDFYPTRFVARGPGTNVYWIEGGLRCPVRGELRVPAVRMSLVDLQQWPIGEPVSAEQVTAIWNAVNAPNGPDYAVEGRLYRGADGSVYQFAGGRLHRFVGARAKSAWPLKWDHTLMLSDEAKNWLAEGNPIIVPPVVLPDSKW